jgi:sugar transferase EpsL
LSSRTRRSVELVIVGTLLTALSPLLAVAAMVVRARLGAPVLYRQVRAGRGGRRIEVVKFRSMTTDVGADGEPLPDVRRLTSLGRTLRATSIDELPQLWSVVRGDLSLIGPRPLPMAYVDRYSEQQRRRLDVVPGLTGLAQVSGRNAVDWPERLAYDVEYVDTASPSLDASIIARTIVAVITRAGVHADGHATMPEFLG